LQSPDNAPKSLLQRYAASFGRRQTVHAMHIDIFSDPVCPWCFIGTRRLWRALDARPELKPTIRWRPFQLNPAMPPEGMDRRTYLASRFGSLAEAERLYANVGHVGMLEGIAFQFESIASTPNTVNAHRLIRYAEAQDRHVAAADAIFAAYFLDGRDIGDTQVLADIASRIGLDCDPVEEFLGGDDGVDAVRGEDMRARQLGIENVPCFIVDKRFVIAGAQEPEAFYSLFDLAASSENNLFA
jgi:predicted DsbA family dithiol-disulfide isomerase